MWFRYIILLIQIFQNLTYLFIASLPTLVGGGIFCVMNTIITNCSFTNFSREALTPRDCQSLSESISSMEEASPFILIQDEEGNIVNITYNPTMNEKHAKQLIFVLQSMSYKIDPTQSVYTTVEPGTKINPLFYCFFF